MKPPKTPSVIIFANYPIRAGADGRNLLRNAVPKVELLEGVVPVLVEEERTPSLQLCGGRKGAFVRVLTRADTHTHRTSKRHGKRVNI